VLVGDPQEAGAWEWGWHPNGTDPTGLVEIGAAEVGGQGHFHAASLQSRTEGMPQG